MSCHSALLGWDTPFIHSHTNCLLCSSHSMSLILVNWSVHVKGTRLCPTATKHPKSGLAPPSLTVLFLKGLNVLRTSSFSPWRSAVSISPTSSLSLNHVTLAATTGPTRTAVAKSWWAEDIFVNELTAYLQRSVLSAPTSMPKLIRICF